ncbi:MAG: A/G-specific adenine glycosylase [Oscillospiraceae bacterium]|nr:A/G-specific adenine glycosylase [Oscillospiraceae bacterium]
MSEPFLIAQPLLHWFWANHRVLPFRSDPTPYHVWVSEIMLQQTRVAAAVPYYERFVQELPDIPALAACEEERLLKLWEGLGYYSRVRNLQKAARIVCEQYGGQLPGDLAALKKLPGIGDYTAGAIASIGFGIPAPAVDGNVLRVFARLYNDEGDIMQPAVKAATTQKVMAQQPAEAPGDFNQALMELGALVCTPGQPDCAACPLQALCLGRQSGNPARLPQKAPKKARKKCELTLCLAQDAAGRWLLQKRGEQGVLAGLWQPPVLAEEALDEKKALAAAQKLLPAAVLLKEKPLKAKHIFTHLEWHMTAYVMAVPCTPPPEGCVWASPAQLEQEYTLPGAFKTLRKRML